MSDAINYDGGLTCALGVTNLDNAIEWYQSTLGFKLQYKMDEMGWCELITGVKGVNVGLSQVENLEIKGGATLTFGVQDLDSARSRLESQGVKFDGETREIDGMVKLATFFDLDGNTLMFYQDLSK
jgi:predicted enzyme related to lactoylglutathione lyase